MNKVKITREQADEIAYHLQIHTNIEILHMFYNTGNSKWSNGDNLTKCILMMDEETLIKALYIGYEVEETPEDKVKAQYESPRHFYNKNDDTYTDVYRKGIKFALDTFNIKIAGVNHE